MIRCPSSEHTDFTNFWCCLSHENRPAQESKPDYVSCVSFAMSRDILLFPSKKDKPLMFTVSWKGRGMKYVQVSTHYNYNTKVDQILKDILDEKYQEEKNDLFRLKDIIDMRFSKPLLSVIITSKVQEEVEMYFPPTTYRTLYYLLGFPDGFEEQGYTIHLRRPVQWVSPWPSDMHKPYRLIVVRSTLSEGGIIGNRWVTGFLGIIFMDDMTGGLVDVRLPDLMPYNRQCDLTRVHFQLSTLSEEPIYFGASAIAPEMQCQFYRD